MDHPSLSCLTYNIHKGFSLGNRDYVLDAIRHSIRDTGADLVALQEVQGEHHGHANRINNWHREAHFEYLADSVWEHYSYGKNAIYQEGHHGNALLSKYPFLSVFNQDISQWRFSQRGLLHGRIQVPGHRAIQVACVHMGFLPYEQWRQTQKLGRWLQQLSPSDPVVLMGDMNDWSRRIHRFLQRKFGLNEATQQRFGRLQATFPSLQPALSLDRIYYKNLYLEQCEVLHGKPWETLSDHCPVYAKFLLN